MASIKRWFDRGKLSNATCNNAPGKIKVVPVVVHEFTVVEEEDPDLYAAEPILEWQKSEAGKWVMDNAVDVPEWWRTPDIATFCHRYKILAMLCEEDAVYYTLRWK